MMDSKLEEKEFLACCGSTKFAKEMGIATPHFPNLEQAVEAARDIWFNKVDVNGWLEAFAAHPQIGQTSSPNPKSETSAQWSKGEQSTALATSTESSLQELLEWNARYRQKFGFVFLICASGRSTPEILTELKKRYTNRPIVEFEIAAQEQMKITELRLAKLFAAKTTTPIASEHSSSLATKAGATEMAAGNRKESSSAKQPAERPSNDGIKIKPPRRNPKKLPQDGNIGTENFQQKTLPNPPSVIIKDIPAAKGPSEDLETNPSLITRKRKHDDYVTVDKDGKVVKNPPKKTAAAWMPSFDQIIPADSTSNQKNIASVIVKNCLLPRDVKCHEEQTSKAIFGATFCSIQQISASLAVLDDRRIRDEKIVKEAEEILRQHSTLKKKIRVLESELKEKVSTIDALVVEKDGLKEDYVKLESQFAESNRLIQELTKSKEEFKEEFVQDHVKELNSKYVFFTRDAWKEMKSEFDIPSDSDDEGEIPQTPIVDGVSNAAGGKEPTVNEESTINEEPANDEATEVQS